MRFSEKLPKLRKDNNLSQEQLADKLGVSRQAVSKWESGNSYPDMEKMLQMCKILNCHLDDIMDDGSIGQESKKESNKNKIDFNAYMKEFLDFITKSYNMFCSMKFKQKIKCIFEMAVIGIILIFASNIIHSILREIIYGLIPISVIWKVVSIIVRTILIILSTIIFIHLFKIRYLDYFITVEDQNVTEKTIEEPIEKKENKYYQEKPKEKIVIRDPKHSTLKFFDGLEKILIAMIKVLAMLAMIPVLISFVMLVGFTFASIFHLGYGILFLFIAIAFVGATLLVYDVIELIYNFIVDREEHWKRMFIIGIIGLVMCGAGAGLGICSYLNYEIVGDFSNEEYKTKTETIKMQENLFFAQGPYYEYEVDNSVNDIQLEIKYVNGSNVQIGRHNGKYSYCHISNDINLINGYKILMQDLKNKQIRDYSDPNFMKVKIITSQENCDKLKANFEKYD